MDLSDPYPSKMNFQITIHLSTGGFDSIPCQAVLIFVYTFALGRFLGAFTKLGKAANSFMMSVRPPTLNNSAPTGRIFMKFGV
jgi:hypothetical protein